MRNRFDEELNSLNHQLIEMGALVEDAINNAVTALTTGNKQLVSKSVDIEADINKKEREIESLCFKLLLHQQPVAKDLRLISAAIKMITDMERIGDQAYDISELVLILPEKEQLFEQIDKMAAETTKMVTTSIDAFVKRDIKLAKSVFKNDDIVDELFISARDNLVSRIRENADYGEQAIDLMMVAKYFERIGDHAVNIAEWVVYSITGKKGEI